MSDLLLGNAAAALAPMRWLIAAWMILAVGQWLTAASLFGSDGLIPWAALSEQRGRPRLARFRRRMSVGLLRTILIVELLAAIVLAANGAVGMTILCLIVLIACHTVLIVLSGEFWADGAVKMGMIAMAGALLVAIGVRLHDPAIALAGILVTGGQLTLCYAVAGWSKLAVGVWRDGSELQRVMAGEIWGHALAARTIRRRPLALAASWGVMLVEAVFPLALLAPMPWLVAALGVMLVFHVTTAVVMRLNLFPWAYLAAYPAVVVLGRAVHATL